MQNRNENLPEYTVPLNVINTVRKDEKWIKTYVDLKEKAKRQGKNLILSENITIKNLYYCRKIKNRIGELTELLRKDNFLNIQKRLAENSMRTGFSCIFSGPPGTGKTETAMWQSLIPAIPEDDSAYLAELALE